MTNEETLTTHSLSVHTKHNTRWLTICGLLMAINVGLSSFGLPVPGGHLYLNDIVISYIAHHAFPAKPKLSTVIAVLVGAVIMVVGYSLGRAYVYSTPAYAWIKLPYEILQALFGVIVGPFLVWKWKLNEHAKKLIDGKW